MGYEAIFKCRECGKTFTACMGGGEFFEEYRCVKCDEITQVEKTSPAQPIGTCYLCGGELRKDIQPMCKKCKSRHVEEVIVVAHYD